MVVYESRLFEHETCGRKYCYETTELRVIITEEMHINGDYDSGSLKGESGDEKGISHYDTGTKAQIAQWKYFRGPRPEKLGQVRSNMKNNLFDYNGLVHYEFYRLSVQSTRSTI